jgi:PAS domain S-box-containing protein
MRSLTTSSNDVLLLQEILSSTNVSEEDRTALSSSDSLRRLILAYDEQLRELRKKVEAYELQGIAEHCLLSVGDNLIDGICVVDLEGRVVSVNKSYTLLTETSEKEVVGYDVRDLLKSGKVRTSLTIQVMEERKRISVLCASPQRDKTYLITGLPLYDKDGSLKGAMTILRDMSEITGIAQSLGRDEESAGAEVPHFEVVDYEPTTRQGRLIGENQKVRKLRELIQYIARNDSTVLLLGETGTGKEVVSREIHELSGRAQRPYIRINCGALPESLIESELFGYEKGAFTGAQNKTKPGIFELADGGTLLLDEITDLPLPLQSKLLRVLQEREIRRLGGTRSIPIDVRLIASTNKDFHALIKNGEFRADLYYRLNVVPIHLLPLRERRDDIPLFAQHFLHTFNVKYGTHKSLDAPSIARLKQYSWPGNVRELENMIERIVAAIPNEQISLERIEELIQEAEGMGAEDGAGGDAGGDAGGGASGREAEDPETSLRRNLNTYEKELLAKALETYGSTYKAAKALGVSQSTVFRKASLYGLLGGSETASR